MTGGQGKPFLHADAPLPPPVSPYHHPDTSPAATTTGTAGTSPITSTPLISPEQQQTLPPSPASSATYRRDGTHTPLTAPDRYLPGLPLTRRHITYLPTHPLLEDLRKGRHSHARRIIQSGDIIGIYSPLPGLDVFHIGIALWHDEELIFRNASSLPIHRYVVDTPLAAYLRERRGIVVYRAGNS